MIQKATLLIGFFFCCLAFNAQEIVFSENFNDCVLADKWSVDLKGNQNVVWGVGIPANPKAEGLSINGSCFLYIDDDLTGDNTAPFVLSITSDWFDGSGFSDLFFKASIHFRRDKTEFFRIIIDNGKERHIIREFRSYNFTGAKFSDSGQITTDISFIAGDSMRIILEYDDDNVWGWWAGIDDIEVTGIRGGEIVMGQDFNNCSLPEDWQTEILTGNDNWQFGKFHDGNTIDGNCFVFFNDDILGETNPRSKIRLYSPYFDASSFSEYILTYDLTYRIYEPTEYLQLYVDNGMEWIPLKTYTTDFGGPEINKSKRDSIHLSPFRSERIRLIWEYNDGGWAWWVGMDNVKVTGKGSINDRCTKAILISTDHGCVEFDNTNALSSQEIGVESLEDAQGFLYFLLETDELTDYTITTQTSFNDRIELLSGTCSEANRMNLVNKDEYGFKGETLTFSPQDGQSYYVRISGLQAEFGFNTGLGCIKMEKKADNVPAPDADPCNGAVLLTSDQDCTPVTNIKALLDGPLPKDNHRSRADVWFKFVPETDGDFEFISDSDFSESLAVYSGSCETLQELNSAYEGKKIALPQAVANTAYYFQVTGYFSTLEGRICGKIVPEENITPANDDCVQAIPLALNSECTSYSNKGGTFSGIRPVCDAYIQSDMWFSFTPDASGNVYIRAKTEFERILSVYEGQCNTLKSMYCEKQGHHCNGYVHLSGLKPGNIYYVMVGAVKTHTNITDGNVCIEIKSTNPEWEKLSLEITQECVSKGAVVFTPDTYGGTGIITVEGPGIEFPVAGGALYYIEARDQDGCIASVPVNASTCADYGCAIVVAPVRKNVSCYGMNDGRIDLEISGGLGVYNVQWNNGQTGNNLSNVPAGNYTATITDGSGCELTQSFTVNQPAQMVTNHELTNPKCYGDSTGAVTLFVTGGISPFTYLWSDGSTSTTLQSVQAGSYGLTVTDATACEVQEVFTITQPDALSVLSEVEQVRCPGDSTGIIRIALKGGSLPYNLLWDNGSNHMYQGNLKAGSYSVAVTDNNNCVLNEAYSVSEPEAFRLDLDFADLLISDSKLAQINTTISGGTPPYQYRWLYNGMETGNYLSSITTNEPGEYQLYVRDSEDCIFESEIWTVSKVSATDEWSENSVIRLYPNPVTDVVNVFLENSSNLKEIRLLDTHGKPVQILYLNNSGKNGLQIPVQHLPSGYYTLECRTGVSTIKAGFIKVQ